MTQVHKYTSTQVHKHTIIHIQKYTSIWVHKATSTQANTYKNTLAYKQTNKQVTNTRRKKITNKDYQRSTKITQEGGNDVSDDIRGYHLVAGGWGGGVPPLPAPGPSTAPPIASTISPPAHMLQHNTNCHNRIKKK